MVCCSRSQPETSGVVLLRGLAGSSFLHNLAADGRVTLIRSSALYLPNSDVPLVNISREEKVIKSAECASSLARGGRIGVLELSNDTNLAEHCAAGEVLGGTKTATAFVYTSLKELGPLSPTDMMAFASHLRTSPTKSKGVLGYLRRSDLNKALSLVKYDAAQKEHVSHALRSHVQSLLGMEDNSVKGVYLYPRYPTDVVISPNHNTAIPALCAALEVARPASSIEWETIRGSSFDVTDVKPYIKPAHPRGMSYPGCATLDWEPYPDYLTNCKAPGPVPPQPKPQPPYGATAYPLLQYAQAPPATNRPPSPQTVRGSSFASAAYAPAPSTAYGQSSYTPSGAYGQVPPNGYGQGLIPPNGYGQYGQGLIPPNGNGQGQIPPFVPGIRLPNPNPSQYPVAPPDSAPYFPPYPVPVGYDSKYTPKQVPQNGELETCCSHVVNDFHNVGYNPVGCGGNGIPLKKPHPNAIWTYFVPMTCPKPPCENVVPPNPIPHPPCPCPTPPAPEPCGCEEEEHERRPRRCEEEEHRRRPRRCEEEEHRRRPRRCEEEEHQKGLIVPDREEHRGKGLIVPDEHRKGKGLIVPDEHRKGLIVPDEQRRGQYGKGLIVPDQHKKGLIVPEQHGKGLIVPDQRKEAQDEGWEEFSNTREEHGKGLVVPDDVRQRSRSPLVK